MTLASCDDLTSTRVANLDKNYRAWRETEQIVQHVSSSLSIRWQKRDYGQAAYYAVKRETPVAYCVGHDVQRPTRRRFVITSTFVHPDHRREGIGRALYRSIIDTGVVLVSDWDLSCGALGLWYSLLVNEAHGDVFLFKDGFVARRRR